MSHAINFPVDSGDWFLIILIKNWEDFSLLNNLCSGTNLWKGLDKFVSTVPGWSNVIVAFGKRLAHSILKDFKNWFCADFAALYEYQPPVWLSPMLPTLALILAKLKSKSFGINS